MAFVSWDCVRASGADELEELDALEGPNKPGDKAYWLDGPSTSALALDLVVITGWDRSLLPAERGGVFDPWLAC